MAEDGAIPNAVPKRYYIVLEETTNGHLISYDEFRHPKELNVLVTAPDWDPDPQISCGKGLHVVDEHPLNTAKFVDRNNPRYFEVVPHGDVVPSRNNDGKYRTQGHRRVREITEDSPEFSSERLAIIAERNYNSNIREAAVRKLNDQGVLGNIAEHDSEWLVRRAAVRRLSDQEILGRIAKNDHDWLVQKAAVCSLSDQKILEHVAEYNDNHNIRGAAVLKLDNQDVLRSIVETDAVWIVRQTAVEVLNNQEVLEHVAKHDEVRTVRNAAVRRLRVLNKQEPNFLL